MAGIPRREDLLQGHGQAVPLQHLAVLGHPHEVNAAPVLLPGPLDGGLHPPAQVHEAFTAEDLAAQEPIPDDQGIGGKTGVADPFVPACSNCSAWRRHRGGVPAGFTSVARQPVPARVSRSRAPGSQGVVGRAPKRTLSRAPGRRRSATWRHPCRRSDRYSSRRWRISGQAGVGEGQGKHGEVRADGIQAQVGARAGKLAGMAASCRVGQGHCTIFLSFRHRPGVSCCRCRRGRVRMAPGPERSCWPTCRNIIFK